MTAAKGTRKTHNIAGGGQEEYTQVMKISCKIWVNVYYQEFTTKNRFSK
jgi:hypothetical protein